MVRELGGLPRYDPESDAVSPLEMLKHERKVNLFMMGRRLHDLHRFGEVSSKWADSSPVATTPGTVFPVADSETDTNPNF